jgi:hypothetical protein
MNTETTIRNERAHITQSLATLRPIFPHGTPDVEILSQILRNAEELSPKVLGKFARSKKRFTTANVMQHFSCSKYKAAGSLAPLVKAQLIEKNGVGTDGSTRWSWIG